MPTDTKVLSTSFCHSSFHVIVFTLAGIIAVTLSSCDSRKDENVVTVQQAEEQKKAAVIAKEKAEGVAANERYRAERNYAVAVGGIAFGFVALIIGGVIGIALGSKARTDCLNQPQISGPVHKKDPPTDRDSTKEPQHVT